jgi:hypothetical protein
MPPADQVGRAEYNGIATVSEMILMSSPVQDLQETASLGRNLTPSDEGVSRRMHALTQKHQHLIMGKQSAVIRSVRSVRILATIFASLKAGSEAAGRGSLERRDHLLDGQQTLSRDYFSLARDLEAILPSTHAAHSVQSALSLLGGYFNPSTT